MKNDLDFIKTESQWPLWPSLPLKRKSKTGGWPELATLFSPAETLKAFPNDPLPYRIVIDNLDGTEVKHQGFATAQCLLDAGWIVD